MRVRRRAKVEPPEPAEQIDDTDLPARSRHSRIRSGGGGNCLSTQGAERVSHRKHQIAEIRTPGSEGTGLRVKREPKAQPRKAKKRLYRRHGRQSRSASDRSTAVEQAPASRRVRERRLSRSRRFFVGLAKLIARRTALRVLGDTRRASSGSRTSPMCTRWRMASFARVPSSWPRQTRLQTGARAQPPQVLRGEGRR